MVDLGGAGAEVSKEEVVVGGVEQEEVSRELETGSVQTRKFGFTFD